MNALLTYRSAESFNRRFKRNIQTRTSKLFPSSFSLNSTPFSSVHLECNLNEQERNQERILTSERKATENAQAPEEIHKLKYSISEHFSRSQHFATESYLHYQGEKFSNRFDANCYLTLSYMLDSHDISRGRGDYHEVLKSINQPTLIIGTFIYFRLFTSVGISSDGLFPINEQEELHENIPNSELSVVVSDEGHDGFLICFDDISRILSSWLRFRK